MLHRMTWSARVTLHLTKVQNIPSSGRTVMIVLARARKKKVKSRELQHSREGLENVFCMIFNSREWWQPHCSLNSHRHSTVIILEESNMFSFLHCASTAPNPDLKLHINSEASIPLGHPESDPCYTVEVALKEYLLSWRNMQLLNI